MSALDPVARLAALMRSQVTVLRRKQPAGRASEPEGKAGADDRIDVASLVVPRLKAVAPSDPQRGSKAARIYLECVMLAEFGLSLANDPAFSLMVDAVHQQMNSDPQLARALAEASELLLGCAPD